ncbi:MAG: CpXC domain-containing protein [Clostridiales bacterium]|nr:CpXC domain-containing protein [Clostridiales bacterium]
MKKYSFINVTEKPDMKEDILKNRVFYFNCDDCNLVAPLTYESMYLDSKKKLAICLATEETDMENLEAWDKKKGMTCRLVDNINDLKEKIMIRDNHLDDRVIELVKIQYLRQLDRELENDTLMNILFDYHGEEKCFLVFFEKKGIGRMPLNMDFYKKTEQEYANQISAHSDDSFMKVDMEWAGDIFFKRS